MSAPVIVARGLGKAYSQGASGFSVFRDAMLGRTSDRGFWALRDVSFSVEAGSAIGIVGRNGSGKSTLLQLICGTLQPTRGSVSVVGRVAAMLELGAGFDTNFTGRENVFLTAAVYGLSDRQIRERFAAIEAFAGIGAYIDRPVSEYSSGMYARLAFAVCAHVDAEVLVVDEILGVGDSGFQQKCHRFMREFRQKGTLIFVSHDANAVLSSCDEAIWLDRGRAAASGPTDEVLSRYMDAEAQAEYDAPDALPTDDMRRRNDAPLDLRLGDRNVIAVRPFDPECASHGFGTAQIVDCFFSGGDGLRRSEIRGGEVVTLHIVARAERDLASPIFGYMFRNAVGQNLFGDNTFMTYRKHPPKVAAGSTIEAQLEFQMPYLPLGDYAVAPSIISGTQASHVPVNWLEDAVILSVRGDAVRHGKLGAIMHDFRVLPGEEREDAAPVEADASS